ncbi:hypothetical protein VTN77DRAFT_4991 [Rasamsonia byssochlamydoides]|uniref:uncharacterized protein n=1 Tax=Rasamsonia byssochlamydoides TaxID=89139 RepID=UPI003742B822
MAALCIPADDRIRAVEEIISYKFTDPSVLHEALQAAGFILPDGNKNLALVGDAALKLILVLDGHGRGASRGKINNIISTKASNAHLADQGFLRGLDKYVYTNPSQGSFVSDGVMATTMQAILGAIFLESSQDISVLQNVVAVLGLSWPE